VIGAVPRLGLATVDLRIVEARDVTAGFPHLGVLNDRGVERDDAHRLAAGAARATTWVHHDVLPPRFAQVLLQLRAERTVIPKAVDAAVDLGGLINEPAALAERHDLIHALGGHRYVIGWALPPLLLRGAQP
jgi:hypothetical protein